MSAQPTQRFVFIVAPLLFAYVCVNRHPVFINYLTGQLPAVSALLAIECLLLPSSLTARDSSALLQLHHRYAPLIVGAAILGHHAVEAELREVNSENFQNTSYNGSPVSLDGKNILIALDESANHNNTNITWKFNGARAIMLDRYDRNCIAEFVIADSCKWHFKWDQKEEFKLFGKDDTKHRWEFKHPPPAVRKLMINIKEDPPTMSVSTLAEDGLLNPKDLVLEPPYYCMLATGNFSVNVTLIESDCPINVTIIDAQLLYDFYEPPTVPPTTVPHNSSKIPGNNATQPLQSSGEKAGLPTWAIIVAGGVGGLLVLVAVVGLIVFCCVRRRRQTPQAQFDDDPNIDAQLTQKEGLIEWDDVMAHAPYKAKLDEQPAAEYFPFKQGDKLDLSTITKCPHSSYEYKELEFKENLKGTEDYGTIEGTFDKKYAADIYYSRPPDRVKTFADRLGRLVELQRMRGLSRLAYCAPFRRYYWISSDPQQVSYLVVRGHGRSVADVKEDAEFHERVGFAYTTFAALVRLHRLGCVHRDVTPAAFVRRYSQRGDNAFCYISHLCLSRFQYDIVGKTWMPRRRHVNYFGTHKYASRAAHAMQERSFKDDLESWFFTAVELIWPTTAKELVMPWDTFNSEVTDRAELHAKYKAEKDNFLRTFGKNKLLATFPAPQFRICAKEILKMTFETMESDYGPRFDELLDGMIDQLPTQGDEASQKAVHDYVQSLNTWRCRAATKNPSSCQ